MEVSIKQESTTFVFTLKGKMDTVTSPEFEKAMARALERGASNVIVNLSELQYISSSGLKSIILAEKQLKERQGSLVFTGLHGVVRDVFKLSGFLSIYEVFDTVESAIARDTSVQTLSEMKMEAVLDNLRTFMEFVASNAREQGLDNKRVSELELAVEEAYVNICEHAYKGGKGDMEILCLREGSGKFVVELRDAGEPFNLLEHQDPDITLDLLDRKIGGLGIMFMKNLMDDVRYRREDDKNIISLVINL